MSQFVHCRNTNKLRDVYKMYTVNSLG